MQFCKMDYAILSNGLCKNVKPIPFNNTFIKEIDNNKLLSTKKVEKFIPPTLEEVEEYCKERNNNVDNLISENEGQEQEDRQNDQVRPAYSRFCHPIHRQKYQRRKMKLAGEQYDQNEFDRLFFYDLVKREH